MNLQNSQNDESRFLTYNLLMVNNIQIFISNNYNININILKGVDKIMNDREYFFYNLSILVSYLMQPTKAYGCRSRILYYHNCKSTNKLLRLHNKYKSNLLFRNKIDKFIDKWKNQK